MLKSINLEKLCVNKIPFWRYLNHRCRFRHRFFLIQIVNSLFMQTLSDHWWWNIIVKFMIHYLWFFNQADYLQVWLQLDMRKKLKWSNRRNFFIAYLTLLHSCLVNLCWLKTRSNLFNKVLTSVFWRVWNVHDLCCRIFGIYECIQKL